MIFKIDSEVSDLLPSLFVAMPVIKGFDNTKGKVEALALLRQAEINLRPTMTLESFLKDSRVTTYLEAFRKFGTDPEIRRPAHVALAKRTLEGNDLPDINPVVNIYNAISLKYLVPLGCENLDMVRGLYHLYIAKGGESWIPIGSDQPKPALPGELVWGDEVDVSTRALNWRQCDRTKMTDVTTNGFFIMEGFTGVNKPVIEMAASEVISAIMKICGGEGKIYWMDKFNPKVEVY